MPTDWRRLFNEIGVEWVDRGPNAILGSPTIKCPLCGAADRSQHMVFSDIGYYCHRDATHRGRNHLRPLRHLLPSFSNETLTALIERHYTDQQIARSKPAPKKLNEVQQEWHTFRPASEHQAYLDYLYGRGFNDPVTLCRRYDLRYSPYGGWAARLLIPIKDDDVLLGWTGRDITGRLSLRYDTLPIADGDPVYVPRAMRATAVLVEGPIDALKVAEATEYLPVTPVSLMGVGISDARILRILHIIEHCRQVLVSLDADIYYPADMIHNRRFGPETVSGYRTLVYSLAFLLPSAYIRRLALPRGFKDFGEIPFGNIVSHLTDANTRGNYEQHPNHDYGHTLESMGLRIERKRV